MLDVSDKEYLAKVRLAAVELGLTDDLDNNLQHLSTFGCGDDDDSSVLCHLYPDFAPLSFYFVIDRRGSDGTYVRWFNGGLIYSGPGCPSDGSFPSLTVSIGEQKHGWSMHT